MLLCAVLIGIAAYFIYTLNTSKSLQAGLGGDSTAPLSLKNINWSETFFSTDGFKELKVTDIDNGETGQLGNKNPFERLKK